MRGVHRRRRGCAGPVGGAPVAAGSAGATWSRVGSCSRICCSSSRSGGLGSTPSSSSSASRHLPEHPQGLGLTARSVQGEREMGPQALAEVVAVEELAQLADHRRVHPQRRAGPRCGPPRQPGVPPPAGQRARGRSPGRRTPPARRHATGRRPRSGARGRRRGGHRRAAHVPRGPGARTAGSRPPPRGRRAGSRAAPRPAPARTRCARGRSPDGGGRCSSAGCRSRRRARRRPTARRSRHRPAPPAPTQRAAARAPRAVGCPRGPPASRRRDEPRGCPTSRTAPDLHTSPVPGEPQVSHARTPATQAPTPTRAGSRAERPSTDRCASARRGGARGERSVCPLVRASIPLAWSTPAVGAPGRALPPRAEPAQPAQRALVAEPPVPLRIPIQDAALGEAGEAFLDRDGAGLADAFDVVEVGDGGAHDLLQRAEAGDDPSRSRRRAGGGCG